ncbi:hypothetical protein RJ641_000359, partial [Dillenia turbinata]
SINGVIRFNKLSFSHPSFQSLSSSSDLHDPPFSPGIRTLDLYNDKEKTHKKKHRKKKVPEDLKKKYKLHPFKSDLPFDFRYSYSETNPEIKPIGFPERPRFSPFGPGRLDRKWTGTSAPLEEVVDLVTVKEEREIVLGEPLSEDEVAELVERYRHSDCSLQINLARNGVYVNVVERVREDFKTEEVARLDCVGLSDCKRIGVKLRI